MMRAHRHVNNRGNCQHEWRDDIVQSAHNVRNSITFSIFHAYLSTGLSCGFFLLNATESSNFLITAVAPTTMITFSRQHFSLRRSQLQIFTNFHTIMQANIATFF